MKPIGHAKADRKLWRKYEIGDGSVLDAMGEAYRHLATTAGVHALVCKINPADEDLLSLELGYEIHPPKTIKGIKLETDKQVKEGQLWLSY